MPFKELQPKTPAEAKKWTKPNSFGHTEQYLRNVGIKEAQDRKEESIAKFNSLNSAIALVSQHAMYTGITEEKVLLETVKRLKEYFYQINTAPF